MSNYIYDKVGKLIKKYHTRNPFDILEQMNVVVKESSNYHNLKGYCLVSCKTTYVVINSQLSEPEKRIVAANELGHVVLHRSLMKLAPMMDSTIYDMISKTEYEANLFAADLLLSDTDIEEMSQNEDMDYFQMCQSLYVSPELVSFKLFSLTKRGRAYNMPLNLNSKFLGNK